MGQVRLLKKMAASRLEYRIISYLEAHNTMSLATVGMEQPHAAAVFYINRKLDLTFISSPASRHGENLATNTQVSATINEDYGDWNAIKGLQLEGDVQQLGRLSEHEDIGAAYVKKFPDVGDFFKDPDELPDLIAGKVAKVRFYKFQPSRIFYIDNSRGFGHREELVPDEVGTAEESK